MLRHRLYSLETRLAGPLELAVRSNMRVEIITALFYGVFFAVLLFVPVVLTRLGGSVTLVSIYLSLSYIGHIFSSMSLVFLRRLPAKTFATVSWTIGRIVFAFLGLASGSVSFLVLTGVFWLLEIVPNPAYTRILQSIYPLAHRGKILALIRLGMAIVILVVTPLAGRALDVFGYGVVFAIAGISGALAGLFFVRLKVIAPPSALLRQSTPNPSPQLAPSPSPISAMRLVLKDRRFLRYALSIVLFGLAGLSVTPLFPNVQVHQLHMSYTDIGLLGTVQSLTWVLGYLVWGRLIDRFGGVPCTVLTFVCQAIAPLTYAFATSGWMLLPAAMGLGLVSAGADISLTSTCLELADPDHTQEYAAAQSTVIGARGLIAPFIGVSLVGLGVPQPIVFALGSAVALSAAWVAYGCRSKPTPLSDRHPHQ